MKGSSRVSGSSTHRVGTRKRTTLLPPVVEASRAEGVRNRSSRPTQHEQGDVAAEEWTGAHAACLWEEFYLGMCDKAADNLSNHSVDYFHYPQFHLIQQLHPRAPVIILSGAEILY